MATDDSIDAWAGDWHARVLDRVRQRGYADVTAYAAERLGVPLLDLADELGQDVAAVQIRALLVEESVAAHAVPRMLRDLLARELHHALQAGWQNPIDDETRFQVAGAIANWSAHLRDHLDRDATLVAGKDLLVAELPGGWRPKDGQDPIVAAFVERCRRGGTVPS